MTPAELQTFLHTHIPASAALAVEVTACSRDGVTLAMPHAPNRNHKNTMFGGSIALGATVCGWSLVHLRCPEAEGNIVIQSGETRYLAPARNGLTLTTAAPDDTQWQQLAAMLAARGKGKIVLETECRSDGILTAVFTGKYVVLKNGSAA